MEIWEDNFKIDKEKVKTNAKKVLMQYRRLQRIAGKSVIDLKSPIISDMPKAQSVSCVSAIDKKLDAEIKRDEIARAIASLSIRHRLILYYAYCTVEKYTINEIAAKIGDGMYHERTIDRDKSDALLCFAEAYKGGILLDL